MQHTNHWKRLSKSALCLTDVIDVEQIALERASVMELTTISSYSGVTLPPGKQVTYWIDQKDHARNKSERLQSSFGINTKVCYLLLVFSMLPT